MNDMKRLFFTLVFAILATGIANAQKFGYVDTQYVLERMAGYQAAQKEIEQMSEKWQKELEEKIAAYKAADLASRLTRSDFSVYTVMTQSATKLVSPATFRAITGHPVAVEMFELSNPFSIEHVSLADLADVMVIAPATANVLAKLAHGASDDAVSTLTLAFTRGVLVAPIEALVVAPDLLTSALARDAVDGVPPRREDAHVRPLAHRRAGRLAAAGAPAPQRGTS